MSQRTYSYADPVLANKLSGLADQFVSGPIRAQQARAQREQMEAQAGLANQQRLAGEFQQDNIRHGQHILRQNDLSQGNEFLAAMFGVDQDGQNAGNWMRAWTANNPTSTDDQRLASVIGAGGNVNADSAFSVAGQDRVSARNSQEDIARTVAGIRATPLTLAQMQGQTYGGMSPEQQIATLFDPVTMAPGHTAYSADGDPRFGQQTTTAPLTPTQMNAGGGSGGSSSVKNWYDPVSGDGGITPDGLRRPDGTPLPDTAQIMGNVDPNSGSGGLTSPGDISKNLENEFYVSSALNDMIGERAAASIPPQARAAVVEDALSLMQQGVSSSEAAVSIAMQRMGIQYEESGGGIGSTLSGLFFGGIPGAVDGARGGQWNVPDNLMPQTPMQQAPMPQAAPTPQAPTAPPMVQGVPTDTGGQQPVDAGPRPQNLTDQQLIEYAQEAISEGRDPEAIRQMLQAWGVDASLSSATMGQ